MPAFTFDVPYIMAGGLTGLIVGLTGVGGGSLMTPILLLIFGVSPSVAVGTDLWFAAITKLAAVRMHHTRGLVDWPIARILWSGSLPAAALTLLAMGYWPDTLRSADFLKHLIGFALLLTALAIVFQSRLVSLTHRFFPKTHHGDEPVKPLVTIAGGAVLGFLVTLTSIGAGALGTVFLLSLYPNRLDPRRLIATDIVHAIPLALVAGAGHLYAGHFDAVLLANLLVGSIPAILIGAKLAQILPHRILRVSMALVLSAVAIRLV